MKWQNKRHELDSCIKSLLIKHSRKKYYIFGAGFLGKSLLLVLQAYGYSVVFIDNSFDKQGSKMLGIPIISLEKYLNEKDAPIVIAVSMRNIPIIKKQLEENFLKHGTDFFLNDEFTNYIFPILSVYCHNKSYVSLAQITLTERCTLRCKKCAHGCFAVDNKKAIDLTLEQVYKSADSFFAKVDFVKEFVLIGGEPLLYTKLVSAIQYIGERYRGLIGTFSITTNGTIVPKEEILKICSKYNVLFHISNYSGQIPRLRNMHQRLVEVLEIYGVQYILGKEEYDWMDYGFDYVKRNVSKNELINVFDACRTPCREIRENRFYYCVMARSVSDNLEFHIGQDDYLDLDKLNGEGFRKELLEFTLGYSEKGYLDMCNHCNGADAKNYPIPAAEQMEKMDN